MRATGSRQPPSTCRQAGFDQSTFDEPARIAIKWATNHAERARELAVVERVDGRSVMVEEQTYSEVTTQRWQ